MGLKKYFQLNRCLFCLDKLNHSADISFGDCYVKGKTDKSSLIIRTKKGKDIFDKHRDLFELEKLDMQEIIESQELFDRKENFNRSKQKLLRLQPA